ncbi:MBL fold metallo-hydrolase [Salinisphaera orenii]|uniref:MBL fold metallo-hydrolase n=1 Tax=Salinisphaera orenii TaxID=856731 RepID=UPI0013A6792C
MTTSTISGNPEHLAPGVQRVTAPNPSAMTGPGTNTFILGHNPAVVVDPAIDDSDHFDAVEAVAGHVDAIWLTHRHPDHARGAAAFAARTGAPIRALPQDQPGQFDIDIDADVPLADGERVELGELTIEAIHTPGHAADHLAFLVSPARILLAGDLLMSDTSVVILPPEGRMTDYFNSLDRIKALPIDAIAPAHGDLMREPHTVIDNAIAHRLKREAEVAACLSPNTPQTANAITARLYPNIEGDLRRAAAAQVEAHLIRLAERDQAKPRGDSDWLAGVGAD